MIAIMIKAVIFDIDGVLLDSFEANLKFFQDLMERFGHRAPTREEFPEIFHLTLWDTIKFVTKLVSKEEIRKIWEAGRSREVAYHIELLVMPEAAESVITILSKNYRLGIVTSRVSEAIYEAPQLARLKKYFSATVSYQDTVNHKPHPEPLLLAAQKLGVKPEESVYIGDVRNDITAAKAAGMKVIIYSKNQFDDADACTPSFRALPGLVMSLAAAS